MATVKLEDKKFNCSINTRFMENYRLSTALQLGTKTYALEKKNQGLEFFTLKDNHFIERVFTDPESSTGFSNASMALHGNRMAVCEDKDGRTIVLASQAEQLHCVFETSPGSGVYTQPFLIKSSMPPNCRNITGITARRIKGDVWIGLIAEAGATSEDTSKYAVFGKWNEKNTLLSSAGYSISGNSCVWAQSEEGNPLYVCGREVIIGINALDGSIVRFPDFPAGQEGAKCKNIAVASKGTAGQDILLAATHGGAVLAMELWASNEWKTADLPEKTVQLEAFEDEQNTVHLFALSDTGALYHATLDMDTQEFCSDFALIKKGVRDVAICNGGATPAFFAPSTQGSLVSYLVYEQISGDWNEQKITLFSENQVQPYASYTTEITVTDKVGNVALNTPIWVWAKETTRIEVNGQVAFIGPGKEIYITTNALGKIHIAQETGLLAVPDIYISFSMAHESENTLTLIQSDCVETKLDGVTKDTLLNAKKDDGSYLLDKKYRTDEIAGNVAQGLNQCVALLKNNNAGKTLSSKAMAMSAGSIAIPQNYTAWSLTKVGDSIEYHVLQENQLEKRLQALRSGASDGWGFFKKIGDLLRAAAQKVIEIVEVVVYTVGDVIKTAISYLVDTAVKIFETVIQTVQLVFNVIESIFNEIAVFFKELFEWLGFIFHWKDILRTKNAIKYMMEEQFTLMEGLVDIASAKVDSAIDKAVKEVKNAFAQIVKQFDPNMSIGSGLNGSACGGKLPPEQEDALSNNFILTQYVAHDLPVDALLNQGQETMAVPPEVQAAIDDFTDILKAFTDELSQNGAFDESLEYFKKVFQDPANMFQYALLGLLKAVEGLTLAALAGVRAVAKGILALVKTVVSSIKTLITKTIKLPFVSALYKKISGSELSLLDLPCLILSIPVTVFYKIANNKAPFENDAEVEQFKKDCNAKAILNVFNVNLNGENQTMAETAVKLPEKWTCILNFTCAVGAFSYYALSTIIDGFSPLGDIPLSVTIAALVCEFVWDLATGLLFIGATISGWEIANYIIVASGLFLDIFFICWENAFPENSKDDWPKYLTAGYGAIALFTGIMSIVYPSGPVSDGAKFATIFATVVLICKIGLSKKLIEATRGVSWGITEVINGSAMAGIPIALCAI